jgi:hypothetical protein
VLGRAFQPIDQREDQHDARTLRGGGFERGGGGAAGGRHVLDDDDVLALEALGRAFDAPLGAVVLDLGAHEEARDRAAALVAEHGEGADQRHRADRQPAHVVDLEPLHAIEHQLGDPGGAGRIEHGRLHVEVIIAGAAGGERDGAAAERARLDQREQLGAGVVGRGTALLRTSAHRLHGRLGRLIARL